MRKKRGVLISTLGGKKEREFQELTVGNRKISISKSTEQEDVRKSPRNVPVRRTPQRTLTTLPGNQEGGRKLQVLPAPGLPHI